MENPERTGPQWLSRFFSTASAPGRIPPRRNLTDGTGSQSPLEGFLRIQGAEIWIPHANMEKGYA